MPSTARRCPAGRRGAAAASSAPASSGTAGAAMASAGGMQIEEQSHNGRSEDAAYRSCRHRDPHPTALARRALARAVVAMMVGQVPAIRNEADQDCAQCTRPTRQGDGQQDGGRAAEHCTDDQLAIGHRRGQDAAQQPPNQHDGPEPGDRLDGNPLGCGAVLKQIEVHEADQSGFGQHVEEDDDAPPQHAGAPRSRLTVSGAWDAGSGGASGPAALCECSLGG